MSDDNDLCSSEAICNSVNIAVKAVESSCSSDDYYEVPCATDNFLAIEYAEEETYYSDSNHDIAEANSVLTHLLSQVKIGMDLTKVTLPTYILERRSLLEMFAEFFAHPNYFTDIPSGRTPLERMLKVVKFYLSSFHAGRKGTMAKKPYNPVLGESFKCIFKVEEGSDSSDLSQGPIPWARMNDLSFIAEQVSHHPPVSAIYAESEKHRICFNCHLWTKSKFLGLSIGVHNVGQGTVYVLDHNEQYVCTFPSAYGRNILGRPWFELGGDCYIYCPQTGLRFEIEFITKPFFGGKKHKIIGKIFDSQTNFTHYTIGGKWNEIMKARGEDEKEFVLVDTKCDDIIRKYVRTLESQECYESRIIWMDVTKYLKLGDIKEATKYKTMIEDKQRRLVKERMERNEEWVPKLFTKVGNDWIYNNMLYSRLKHRFVWK